MKRKATARLGLAVVGLFAVVAVAWLLRSPDVLVEGKAPSLSAERHESGDRALLADAPVVSATSVASSGASVPAAAKVPANGSAPSVRKAQDNATPGSASATAGSVAAAGAADQPLSVGLERVLAHYEEVSRRDTVGPVAGEGKGIFRQRILRVPDDTKRHVLVEETVLPDKDGGEERIVARHAMVADQVLVKLRPGVSAKELEGLSARYGAKVVDKPLAQDLYLVRLQGLDPDAVRNSVAVYKQATASVSYAEPDYLLWISEMPNDPMFSGLWGMHNVGQMSAGTATIVAGGTTLSGNVMMYSGLAPSPGVTGSLYDCGVGRPDEFPAGVSNNIAVIKRGGLEDDGSKIKFSTKAANAMAAGAKAAIVYNDVAGALSGVSLGAPGNWLPVAAVSDTQGEQLLAMGNVSATVTIEPAPSTDHDIDAPEAWDVVKGSHDIVVGVIDTGVDYNHPDLRSNMWTNAGETPGNGIDDDGNGYIDDIHGWNFYYNSNNPMDDHLHGTHCAGTIGAVGNNGIGLAGVCWNVRIMALKFLSAFGSGEVSAAIPAMEYARRNGAKLTSNSWGGTQYSQAMKDAIDASGAAGVLFVAAAGNDGTDNDGIPHYPSSFDSSNIIAVAATDYMDNRASFSCYGLESVDLGAPGVDILSTFPTYMTAEMVSAGYTTNYGTISGTSMATPHVAGMCALLWSLGPDAIASEVKARVLGQTDPIPALAGKCVTGGRLNAYKTVAISQPPDLRVEGVAVSDAAGNGDGIANPGETVQLGLTLKNFGVNPASGVNATLSTADPMVTVVDGAAAFGMVRGWGSRNVALDTFAIAISPSCHTPREVTLNLNITDSESGVWTETCKVTVFSSSLISGRVTRLADGASLSGATVEYHGPRSGTATTDVSGAYSILMTDGSATLTARHTGYCDSAPVSVTVPPDASGVNFIMGYSDIDVTPSLFNVVGVLGETLTRTLMIHNAGNTNLTWCLSQAPAAMGATIRKTSGFGSMSPQGMAFDGTALWLNDKKNVGTIFKVDPVTGKVLRTLNVGSVVTDARGLDWDSVNGWLWIAEINGQVKAVDPKTGALMRTIPGGQGTTCVAVGDGYVWVLTWDSRTVTRRDAATGAPVGAAWTVPALIPARVSGVEYYNGAIWISGEDGMEDFADGKVYKLNPADGSILGVFQADVPMGIAGGYNVSDLAVDEKSGLMWLLTYEYGRSAMAVLVGMGEPAPWLKAAPTAGTVQAGGSATVALALDTTVAGLGSHETTIEVVSNDPEKPKVNVPVRLSVMMDAGNRPPVITIAAWADSARIFASSSVSYGLLPATTAVHVAASDLDGDTLSYAWSLVSGYGVTTFAAADAADSAVTLSGRSGSGYMGNTSDSNTNVLRVTVSDGRGGVATSEVTVTVDYGLPIVGTVPEVGPGGYEVAGVYVYMSENGNPTNFSLTLYGWDVNNSTLTWSVAPPAVRGTATASGTGTSKVIGYTPPPNYSGWDEFMVQVTNARGLTDSLWVYVVIAPINNAPVAVNDVYSVPTNTLLRVGAPGVLRNDLDVDGGAQ